MIRPSSDGKAIVDDELHWIPIKENSPPVGVKVQLINIENGTAVTAIYSPRYNWTHWFPLPVFKE